MQFWIQNPRHGTLVPIQRKDTERQVSSVTPLVIDAGLNDTISEDVLLYMAEGPTDDGVGVQSMYTTMYDT